MPLAPKIYLDYNATTPILPEAKKAMMAVLDMPMNASALHSWGQQAKRLINQAHRTIGDYSDAHPDRIFMTSGGTEANNWVLKALPWNHIFISATSHDSIYKGSENFLEVPVDTQGLLELEHLEKMLKSASEDSSLSLLSFVHAHNESGVIQPTEDLVALAKKYGVFVHADTTQSLGKIPFSFTKMDVDFATISAHKVGGPQGVGALIVKDPSRLMPLIKGGGQEKGHRSGTENVAGILGFAEALKSYPHDHMSTLRKWHETMEKDLFNFAKHHQNPLYIYGAEGERLPNTTCLSMPFVESATQVMRFDLAGIAVSMGSACSSGRTQVSRSLGHMGPNKDMAKTAIRVSSGWNSKEEDFKTFSDVWKKIYLDLKDTAE
jgi:cysteine desulfurase